MPNLQFGFEIMESTLHLVLSESQKWNHALLAVMYMDVLCAIVQSH